MESQMKKPTHSQIDIFDATGRLVGTIIQPVAAEALGPGREKVFLKRPATRRDSGTRAA